MAELRPFFGIHVSVRRMIEKDGFIGLMISKVGRTWLFDFVPKKGEGRQVVKIVQAFGRAEEEAFFRESEYARGFAGPGSVPLLAWGRIRQGYDFYGWIVYPKLPTLNELLPEIHQKPQKERETLAKRMIVQLLPHLKRMNGVGAYHNNINGNTVKVKRDKHSFHFMLYDYSRGKEYDQVLATHWGHHKVDAIGLISAAASIVSTAGDEDSNKWPEWLSALQTLVTTLPRGALVPYDRMKFMSSEEEKKESQDAPFSILPRYVHQTLKEAVTRFRTDEIARYISRLFEIMWRFEIDQPFEPMETLLNQVESRSVRLLVPNKYVQIVVYVAEEDYEQVAWVSFVPLTRLSAKGASCLLEVILVNPWGVLRECFELCK